MPDAVRLLLSGLGAAGVEPELIRRAEAAIRSAPDASNTWIDLAAALRRLGNYHAASLVYEFALPHFPQSAVMQNNYGILLRDWGRGDRALEAFDKAIAIDPSYARAKENKGRMLEVMRRYVDARNWYAQALDLDPGNARIACNIGACWMGEGDINQATSWFAKSLEFDPNHGDALFNLCVVKLDSGDRASAALLVDRLSRLLPNDHEVAILKSKLEASEVANPENSVHAYKAPPTYVDTSDDPLSDGVEALGDRLAGNPRSVFISYAWSDSRTQRFAARLSRELRRRGYDVVLDQEHKLEVVDILYLLIRCQNVVALNDRHYVESCLLGKVPVTEPTSPYPSFALPADASEEYLAEVFKISAVTWEMARQLKTKGRKQAAQVTFMAAASDGFDKAPGLRVFVEGWRVDEIQLVFHNIDKFRSVSMLYLGGANCLAGYPLFDFSKGSYFSRSLVALIASLERATSRTVDEVPMQSGRPDLRQHRRDSPIWRAKLWRIVDEEIIVWRPSLTPSGGHAAVLSRFKDWTPL